jgi:hypothetical protein
VAAAGIEINEVDGRQFGVRVLGQPQPGYSAGLYVDGAM